MNERTQQQIYDLSGFEPAVIVAQMEWSAVHVNDKEACKLAAFEWGRKPKDMAYVWDHLIDKATVYTRHELLSLILIASLNKFERALLYEQWRDTTMSYEQVREAVNARKQPKPRERKPKVCGKCGALLT